MSKGGLIMPNLFNIKGLPAEKGFSLCKGKPAESGQIGPNPKGGSYFGAFGGKPDPKGNNPMAPVFHQNHSKYDPSNHLWTLGTLSGGRHAQ